ncbi:hypothetical protein PANA5342_3882 [Pantoea ananatis LMG 5342]|nr:hypothetical protein PANA5342_3882 [Pantoea ananatis LMG 5342]
MTLLRDLFVTQRYFNSMFLPNYKRLSIGKTF